MPPKGQSKVKRLLPGNRHLAYTRQPGLGWVGGRKADSQSPAPLRAKALNCTLNSEYPLLKHPSVIHLPSPVEWLLNFSSEDPIVRFT